MRRWSVTSLFEGAHQYKYVCSHVATYSRETIFRSNSTTLMRWEVEWREVIVFPFVFLAEVEFYQEP